MPSRQFRLHVLALVLPVLSCGTSDGTSAGAAGAAGATAGAAGATTGGAGGGGNTSGGTGGGGAGAGAPNGGTGGGGACSAPFGKATSLVGGGNCIGVATADFDADGSVDVVTVGQSGGGGAMGAPQLTVFLQKAGGFQSSPSIPVTGGALLLSGDFDGDGKADVAVAPSSPSGIGPLSVHWGVGNGSFTDGPTFGGSSFLDGAAADFDGDGHVDIALDGFPTLAIYSPDKQGNAPQLVTVKVGSAAAESAAAGDVTGDHHADFVTWVQSCPVGTPCDAQILTVSLDGAGNRVSSLGVGTIVPPDFPKLRLGDLDGDGQLDVVLLFDTDTVKRLVVAKGKGDGTFGTPIGTMVDGVLWGSSFDVGDVNGDGRGDVVLSLGTSPPAIGHLGIVFSLADGTLSPAVDTGLAMGRPRLVDVNGDGRLDVLGIGRDTFGSFVAQVALNGCK